MAVLFGYLLIFFVEKVMFDADGIMHDMEGGHEKEILAEATGEAKLDR